MPALVSHEGRDLAVMAPGHDAWTVGDVPSVVIDRQGFADYARR
jgi:hypothetical protein